MVGSVFEIPLGKLRNGCTVDSMALDSCMSCGHALAIADHRCRHCAPATMGTQRGVKSITFYLLVAFAALVVGLLIYNVFLR